MIQRRFFSARSRGDFSGLSLRAGFATAAAIAGVAAHSLMELLDLAALSAAGTHRCVWALHQIVSLIALHRAERASAAR